jgi:hypothetical protein
MHTAPTSAGSTATATTPSGFTATLLNSGGFRHDLVVTPLPGLPPTVNLRVMTRYDHSRDPEHRREVLNLSLGQEGLRGFIQQLQRAQTCLVDHASSRDE